MLRELLQRELSWGAAPGFALLAAVAYPFICLLLPVLGPMPILILCGVCIGDVLLKERVTRFEAALPIAGRDLVAARLLAGLAIVWFPALVAAAETLIFRGWKKAGPLLEIAAVSSLVMLIGQSFRMREMKPSRVFGVAAIQVCAGAAITVIVLMPWLLSHCGAVLGVCFVGCAVETARLRGGLPEGFQIAPEQAARARRWALRLPAWCRAWSPMWLPAWRSLFKWRDLAVMAWLPWAALSGMSWLACPWAVSPALAARRRIDWLLVLPVSRRRLLLMMLVPWLGILSGALSVGGQFRPAAKTPAVATGYSDVWEAQKTAGSGTPNVLVPASFWRWAWARQAPAIQSPWGERTQPKTFHRLGLAFYNPYSVAPENSARFLEWQVARATEAAGGSDGVAVLRRIRMRVVEVLAGGLAFLGMFYLVLWGKGKRRVLVWIAWFGTPALFLLDHFCTGWRIGLSGPLSDIIAARMAAILPQHTVALVMLAALLLGSAFWAVEKRFEKEDVVPDLKREDSGR